ncbi:MAG: glutamine synthetase [Sphingosinicella sp.]|nr:glutamine synthetase [Sphingosinicella sp.]
MTNQTLSAAGTPLCAVLTTDLAGITRGRSFPSDRLATYLDRGIGWVPANVAIDPFGAIGAHPWGSSGDLRIIPDPDTHVRVEHAVSPPLEFMLGDIVDLDGAPWMCCARGFLKTALDRFRAETALEPVMAFEHEFRMEGTTWADAPAFSLGAMRRAAGFCGTLMAALAEAGAEPEMILPEYGRDQFEVTLAPAPALQACDRAVVLREITREIARAAGMRASFTPKPEPDAAGSGVHIHFSLNGPSGNVTFDAARPGRLSEIAAHFTAGIVKHLPAITAFSAPSPISYLRLVEHSWSAAYAIVGERNREAALRICPTFPQNGPDAARQFNVEFRACDATANPYLVAALIVLAGLEGIRGALPLPELVSVDPSDLPDAERAKLTRLPQSLGEALAALDADAVVKSWLPPELHACHSAMKTGEIERVAKLSPEDICALYGSVY